MKSYVPSDCIKYREIIMYYLKHYLCHLFNKFFQLLLPFWAFLDLLFAFFTAAHIGSQGRFQFNLIKIMFQLLVVLLLSPTGRWLEKNV